MPVLVNPPKTIEDAVLLVETDPRYASQINPAILMVPGDEEQSLANIKRIQDAAVVGLDKIMKYQANYGVAYNESEHEEMIDFANQCTESVAFLMRASREYAKLRQKVSSADQAEVKE